MSTDPKTTTIVYVTSSPFKKAEAKIIEKQCKLNDGVTVGDLFHFEFENVQLHERLDVNLSEIVRAEAKDAYRQLLVPCVVEHAGLVFEDTEKFSYPGGLTKPMWNALDEFVKETVSKGRRVIARAAVAYCDGMSVNVFIGETRGVIASQPRGKRKFYWDTVFIPDDQKGRRKKTYAEIVDSVGLKEKVLSYSQSRKALLQFLEWKRSTVSELWGA